MAWETHDYEGVATQLTPWPADLLAEFDSWRTPLLRDWLFRSLLRLGRDADAQAAAQSFFEHEADSSQLAILHAHRKDIDGLTRLLNESAADPSSLYNDEDVGSLVRCDPLFLPLRCENPPGLLHYYTRTNEVVLLLRQPVAWDAGHLREVVEKFTKGSSPVEVTALPPTPDRSSRSFLVRVAGQTCAVTIGSGAYDRDQKARDPRLRAALAEHGAWLAVDSFDSDDDRAARSVARQLAAELADENCLAFFLASSEQLVVHTAEFRQSLRDDPLARQLAEAGEPAWLYYVEPSDRDPDIIRAATAVSRRLRELNAAFSKAAADDEFLLEIQLEMGHLPERHWLFLLEIKRQADGTNKYVARVTTDSHFAAGFRRGNRTSSTGSKSAIGVTPRTVGPCGPATRPIPPNRNKIPLFSPRRQTISGRSSAKL